MTLLVNNCPRCRANNITFDVAQELPVGIKYDWQRWYELFCVCRNCHRSTTFVVSQREIGDKDFLRNDGVLVSSDVSANDFVKVERYVDLRDHAAEAPPDHLPEKIQDCFIEAATCHAVGCWNAAGTMFRMCVDIATRELLPTGVVDGLNSKKRRDLGLRLPWLFENGLLSDGLQDLSACIKEDGNDGAHAGTLVEEDAEDLLDFTRALLERLYTEPEKLRLAKERRERRRD